MTERANWGRWGPDDQMGALNLLTEEVVAGAAALVRSGRRYGLGLTLDPRHVPSSPTRRGAAHFMTLDGGDYAAGMRLPDDMRVADDFVVMPTHWGTHIDALAHVWRGDELYNGHPATSVRSYGATRCGIDKVGVIATRGVLLDVPGAIGVDRLDPGYAITPADVEAALVYAGVELRPGDAVLLRTGWIQVLPAGSAAFYASQPGLGLEAALALAERDVALVCADNSAVEPMAWIDGRSGDNPVHQSLIREYGIHLLEMLDLEAIARDRIFESLLVVSPLPFKGGVGSPVNPVALC